MSTIEWTDKTWNPVVGCSAVSPGCKNCYAARLARRLERMGIKDYEGIADDRHFTGAIRIREDKLLDPLKWRKPRRVFVNSMSDLFHDKIPNEFIDKTFAVMNVAEKHTFQILTKRPGRMKKYLQDRQPKCGEPTGQHPFFQHRDILRGQGMDVMNRSGVLLLPLANVWIGATCESQQTFDARIGDLIDCPAAVRFISFEPLLTRIDMGEGIDWSRLHWAIIGGESGPGARECRFEWIRELRDQLIARNVKVFIKQLGSRPLGEWQFGEPPHYYLMRRGAPDKLCESRCKNGKWNLRDRKGGNMSEWPEDLRIREYPAGGFQENPLDKLSEVC